MTLRVLIDSASGIVRQWQDTSAFDYAAVDASELVEVTNEQWALQETPGDWYITNGTFTQTAPPVVIPVLSAADILASNTTTRNALLLNGTNAQAPLQDAVDLAIATTAETAMLTSWKQYSVAVNRVDLTQTSPTWPAVPETSSYA